MDKDKFKRVINGGRAAWQVGRVAGPMIAHVAVAPPNLPVQQPTSPVLCTPTQSPVVDANQATADKVRQLAQHRKEQLAQERQRGIELGYQLREPDVRHEPERK